MNLSFITYPYWRGSNSYFHFNIALTNWIFQIKFEELFIFNFCASLVHFIIPLYYSSKILVFPNFYVIFAGFNHFNRRFSFATMSGDATFFSDFIFQEVFRTHFSNLVILP